MRDFQDLDGGMTMVAAKKGTAYVCGVCGTTLIVTEEGVGMLEDIVCCEAPMACEVSVPKKKSNANRS